MPYNYCQYVCNVFAQITKKMDKYSKKAQFFAQNPINTIFVYSQTISLCHEFNTNADDRL